MLFPSAPSDSHLIHIDSLHLLHRLGILHVGWHGHLLCILGINPLFSLSLSLLPRVQMPKYQMSTSHRRMIDDQCWLFEIFIDLIYRSAFRALSSFRHCWLVPFPSLQCAICSQTSSFWHRAVSWSESANKSNICLKRNAFIIQFGHLLRDDLNESATISMKMEVFDDIQYSLWHFDWDRLSFDSVVTVNSFHFPISYLYKYRSYTWAPSPSPWLRWSPDNRCSSLLHCLLRNLCLSSCTSSRICPEVGPPSKYLFWC